MLQQTQAARVTEKYELFIKTFPDFPTLNRAPLSQILKVWQGMGYNRRALDLKRSAEKVMREFGGVLPQNPKTLETFPGIGQATAAAISVYAFNQPTVFIETNIRTVFIHHFFKKKIKVSDKDILPLVEQTIDKKNSRQWYWALMDYGAYLKQKLGNLNIKSSHYSKQSAFFNL